MALIGLVPPLLLRPSCQLQQLFTASRPSVAAVVIWRVIEYPETDCWMAGACRITGNRQFAGWKCSAGKLQLL